MARFKKSRFMAGFNFFARSKMTADVN